MNEPMSIISLFLEGLLSFFSPCVLPLIPLYISYLTKDTKKEDEDGNISYDRKKTFLVTLGFVLGISTVFFLVGLSSRLLNAIFKEYTVFFQIGGGILLILFGLVSGGLIKISLLNNSSRKMVSMEGKFGFAKSWLLGFFFSFAWSPCVGPLLAQAMLMAAQKERLLGWLYISSYTLGFIAMFVLIGLFTQSMLNFLKKNKNIVRYTGVIATVVVIAMGGYMLYQGAQNISAMQKQNSQTIINDDEQITDDPSLTDIEKYDFILNDGKGNPVHLSSFKGKKVVMSFFGTWCYYCNQELPGLKTVQDTMDDVQVLLISHPGLNSEGDINYIEKFLKDGGYNFLVLHDSSYSVLQSYGVKGFPYTFIFNEDGSFKGYIPGYCEEEQLIKILRN